MDPPNLTTMSDKVLIKYYKKVKGEAYQGYMGTKRKILVKEFGYDVKSASHLIRLLRMGIEFLKEGILYVEREDASELLDIKRGKWSLERIKKEADLLFVAAREAYLKSPLPPKPDTVKIEQLMIEALCRHHSIGNYYNE